MTDPTGNFSYPPKPHRESVPYNPFTLLAGIIVALVILCITGCLGVAFLGGPSDGYAPVEVVTPSPTPNPAP